MRLIFAGTPIFAKEVLAELNKHHTIVGVICQPDRPVGRGKIITACATKEYAIANNILVLQPQKLGANDKAQIQQLKADIIIVVAFGQILPKEILTITPKGCLNIHASLLPRWRGSAPIQRAILAGDDMTGICIMQMAEGLDTGSILTYKTCDITNNDTTNTLSAKLIVIAKQLIIDTLAKLDNILPVRQRKDCICYAHKLVKSEAFINWDKTAIEIDRQIRAFNPYPIAQSYAYGNKFNNSIIRIISAEVLSSDSKLKSGTVISQSKLGIDVATTSGSLRILKLQVSGKKITNAKEFNNSYKLDYFKT